MALMGNHKAEAAPPKIAANMTGRSAGAPTGPAMWPLHPFLFAAASVLALYATTENLSEMRMGDMLPVLAAALAGAAIVVFAVAALVRSVGPRAAVPAGVIIVGCVHFADLASLFRPLNRTLGAIIPAGAALPLMLILVLVLGLAGAVSAFRFPTLINAPLNAFALVLFLTPVWNVASYHWETANARRVTPRIDTGRGAHFATRLREERPDIFYFIFDRYGSQRVLRREYGFDNTPFIEFLKETVFTSRRTATRTIQRRRLRSPPPSTWTTSTSSAKTRSRGVTNGTPFMTWSGASTGLDGS